MAGDSDGLDNSYRIFGRIEFETVAIVGIFADFGRTGEFDTKTGMGERLGLYPSTLASFFVQPVGRAN